MDPSVGVLIGDAIYTWLAFRLARKERRHDVCAMPLGIDTPSMFALSFGVVGPAFLITKDGMKAWQIGMAVLAIMGVAKVIAAPAGAADEVADAGAARRQEHRALDDVPQLVAKAQERAHAMGLAARAAWEQYFCPEATVGSVVAWARLLIGCSRRRPAGIRFGAYTSSRLGKAKLRYLFR